MPRISDETRRARRREILDAARRCFARKGFSATTIADLCEESGISAGGIYTHFENKHDLAAAIGADATGDADLPFDPGALADRLATPEGELDARLDLQLWAESLHDETLRDMVLDSMDRFRNGIVAAEPAMQADGRACVIEALVLGAEVQRALNRTVDAAALLGAVERLTTQPDRAD